MGYSRKFLEKTIAVWQPYSATALSAEDARQIAENMTNLFSFLIELQKKYGIGQRFPLTNINENAILCNGWEDYGHNQEIRNLPLAK